jgi:DNA-binding MarR family transcriptional regulator
VPEDVRQDEAAQRAQLVARVVGEHSAIGGTLVGVRLEQLMQLTLTLGQLKLLLRVVATGGETTNGLAEHFGISTAAVSPVVDKLVERGLLVRRPDAADRRVKHLLPSTEGARLVHDVFEDGGWTREQVLSTVSLPGLRALADGLAAVRAALAGRAPAGTDPLPPTPSDCSRRPSEDDRLAPHDPTPFRGAR